jgi:hypothetical protein
MLRPTDAIVTGFTRSSELARHAFAPLLQLKQEGLIRAVRYVTWDKVAMDACVLAVEALGGVEISRVPMPAPEGNATQQGVIYQVENLSAALARVPEDDALVVKLRPDFVFRTEFLRRKLKEFERRSVIETASQAFGIELARVPLKRKIWIPWADSNQPFFYEDAAFMGLKRDLGLLVTPRIEAKLGILDDPLCGMFAHVVRWADIFLPSFPIFGRYLAEYAGFKNDIEYRKSLIPLLLDDPFFWNLILANAWILWTGFHIDCGDKNDLLFFPNHRNPNIERMAAAELNLGTPYDEVQRWRIATRAGLGILPGVDCLYGRLMDGAWPRSVFTDSFEDVPAGMLTKLAFGVSRYQAGVLASAEDAFYAKLRRHAEQWVEKSAA